ncbi:MAG: class I SAM-dependent methyltransferase [Lysobacterales bacterium]|nr:MAG: class I SAM-dependent methyltransferase [Xanthomonadales bacterium]
MMAQRRRLARIGAVALLGIASMADAQTRADCEREYTPQRGQEGKDVVWAPTEDSMLVRMLAMANITPADKVYDLGSGDGKIPIAAAKHFGATAVGVEYDADLVKHARCLAAAERVEDRVTFIQGDIFEAKFSDATVVTLYLLPALNLRLRPALLKMKPGTRIVSYSFTMGDWEPDDHIDSFGDGSAYLWIVPAYAGGSWTLRAASGEDTFDVELEQIFQKLRGFAGDAKVAGSLRGDELNFAFMQGAEQVHVAGRVTADRIAATVTRGETSTQYVGTRN